MNVPWRDAGLHRTWRASWHFPETVRRPGLESFPWKSRWRYETGVIRTHGHWAGQRRLALGSSRGLEFEERFTATFSSFTVGAEIIRSLVSLTCVCLSESNRPKHLVTSEKHVEEYSCCRDRFEDHMPNWIRAAEREHDATSGVTINPSYHFTFTMHSCSVYSPAWHFYSIYTCIENAVLIYHYI